MPPPPPLSGSSRWVMIWSSRHRIHTQTLPQSQVSHPYHVHPSNNQHPRPLSVSDPRAAGEGGGLSAGLEARRMYSKYLAALATPQARRSFAVFHRRQVLLGTSSVRFLHLSLSPLSPCVPRPSRRLQSPNVQASDYRLAQRKPCASSERAGNDPIRERRRTTYIEPGRRKEFA
ncbi:hypothetical protein LX32DRAFT_250923 [Colletotrichum zoysiae]|uniref:Uncharacterized protein n=1 Tax=Colletotrichum zoysiae TaxID=1216348 RepID=A0AAD9H435_9PEZI|nr:hypothetical protein LX32DRAFT_250923 [Colletotrichum zoysiae]